MDLLALLFLVLLNLPSSSGTMYMIHPGQRLFGTPLATLYFNQQSGGLHPGRCVLTCEMTSDCKSVNVHWDSVTQVMTCEILYVVLQDMQNGLSSAAGWVFAQIESPWVLAFRVSSAVNLSAWDVFHQDGLHDDPNTMQGCVLPSSSLPCTTHFRSYIMDNWNNITQVRMSLYKNGAVVAQVTFDGQGSDRTSWLEVSRLLKSSWTDMTTSSQCNYFSVEGLPGVYRRFYLSSYHNGCEGDVGWMVVADYHPPGYVYGQCPWEKTRPFLPTIYYMPSSTAQLWAAASTVDFMMIYVKFNESG